MDVAVLHLGENVAEGLVAGHAVEGGSWQVETQPHPNDPKLYGTITDTHRRFIKKDGRHDIHVLQLYEMQSLGDYKGYSGSLVVLKSSPNVVIGVLIEQLRSRLSLPGKIDQPIPATNVLYAIPIQDVLDRFRLTAANADGDKHPVLRANFDHLIKAHTQLFAGREETISQIHTFIEKEPGGYIFIEGLSGYGKTSLLAKIVQDHPEFAYHFISQAYRTYGSDFNPTDLEWMMLSLCEQLEQDSSEDFGSLKNPKDRFHHLLRTPSQAKKIIIIDGVDEIDRHPNYLRGVLPTQLPSGMFLIFSARKLGERDYLEAIGLKQTNIQLPIDLPGLDARAIQQLLNRAGGQATLYSTSEPFVDRLYAVSEGDPFYLRFLIEDVAEGIVRPENLTALPTGLEAYLDMQFEILARSAYLPQHRAILDIVITAHGSLAQDELIYMTNKYMVEEFKRYGLQLQGLELLDSFKFDEVIRDIRRFLLENDGMFTFCHKRFKDYFNEKK